jgi:phosphoesterase RecJ-like protein
MTWNSLRSLIDRNDSFLISSHQSLDGDCVGSQLSFYWYLTSLGKRAVMYNHDPVPPKFMFLPGAGAMVTTLPGEPFDVLVVLDCSNLTRLGWDTGKFAGGPIINIDHHRDNASFGTVNIVEVGAAATGEIITRFFDEQGIAYPPEIAEALYTAVLTDTGGFRFPNTTSGILHLCGTLAEKGAVPPKIYDKVYASNSPAGLLLQSRIWSSLKFYFNGRVCSLEMPMSVLDELGALYSDSEGMVDITTTAAGVQVGIMTKYTDTETHFSLRSRGMVDVGRIAQKIPGGGGHSSAAGCTLQLPLDRALAAMLAIVEQELR